MTTDAAAAPAGVLRVNMSDQEAKSEARVDLPAGKYHLKITDVTLQYTKETAKNPNKPYLNIEFTVQDGQYAGRKDWTNAMCFEGALYTISQILKALGMELNPKGGNVNIPIAKEFYLGKDIWGIRRPDKNQKDEATGQPRIQLNGFSKYEGGVSAPAGAAPAAAAKASVLP